MQTGLLVEGVCTSLHGLFTPPGAVSSRTRATRT